MQLQKEIGITVPRLSRQSLSVRLGGWVHGPKLLKNGEVLPRKKGVYQVLDDAGKNTTIKFKYYFIDPVPKLIIDGETVSIARSLKWYEYAWAGWPGILGLTQGGAIGAGFGVLGSQLGVHVFRSDLKAPLKWSLVLGIGILSMVAYFAVTIPLIYMLHRG